MMTKIQGSEHKEVITDSSTQINGKSAYRVTKDMNTIIDGSSQLNVKGDEKGTIQGKRDYTIFNNDSLKVLKKTSIVSTKVSGTRTLRPASTRL